MATGDARTAFYSKQLLDAAGMKEYGLEYALALIRRVFKQSCPAAGLLSAATLSRPEVGKFSVSADPLAATDGAGNILDLAGADRTALVPFEDAAGVEYFFGLRYAEVPHGVERNVRTGRPSYPRTMEEIGELLTPSAAALSGAGVRLELDDLNAGGDPSSWAGRTAVVYLQTPASALEEVAYEEATVQWDGSRNYVVSAGTFGQSTASVTPGDYRVFVPGVSVRRGSALPASYAPMGSILDGAYSSATRSVISFDLTDIREVLRVDDHGRTKVRVAADNLDNAEPQLMVLNSSNSPRFLVTERGSVEAGESGAYHKFDGRFDLRPNGIDVALAAWASGGTRYLNLIDVPFAEEGYSALQTRRSSVLGALEEIRLATREARHVPLIGSVSYDGLEASAGPGAAVTVAQGAFRAGGKLHPVPSTEVPLADGDGTYWVYGQDDGTLAATKTKRDAAVQIPLWKVSLSGGAVTVLADLRLGPSNQLVTVTVGAAGGNEQFKNFRTLRSAVEYLETVYAQTAAVGNQRLRSEILLVQSEVLSETLTLPAGITGLRIRGCGGYGNSPRLEWGFDGPAVTAAAPEALEIVDLNFYSTVTAGSAMRAVSVSGGSGVRFSNCRFYFASAAPAAPRNWVYLDACTGTLFERCSFFATSGLNAEAAVYVKDGTDTVLRDCRFSSGVSPLDYTYGGVYSDAGSSRTVVDGCWFYYIIAPVVSAGKRDAVLNSDFVGTGAAVLDAGKYAVYAHTSGSGLRVAGNRFLDHRGTCVAVDAQGVEVCGNRFEQSGLTSVLLRGVLVTSSYARVINNDFLSIQGVGVYLSASAPGSVVQGNTFREGALEAVYVGGSRIDVSGNSIESAVALYGITVEGSRSSVRGNSIRLPAQGAKGIYAASVTDVLIDSNHLQDIGSAGAASVAIDVQAARGCISNNRIYDVEGVGIKLNGSYLVASANVVFLPGLSAGAAEGNSNGILFVNGTNHGGALGNVVHATPGGVSGIYFEAGTNTNAAQMNISTIADAAANVLGADATNNNLTL